MLGQLKSYSDNAYRTARRYSNRAYKSAMNHPKTSTAVVLGTGAAAAILWAIRRNGGFHATRKDVMKRVRG